MSVNVIETRENLEQDALHALGIHAFVIPSFHQLVKVAVHVLHTNVKFLAEWIQEDIQSRDQMSVSRESS